MVRVSFQDFKDTIFFVHLQKYTHVKMNPTTPQNLDPHSQELISQYRRLLPVFSKMADTIPGSLKDFFAEAGFIVAAVEHRVKTEESLTGKLLLKGGKYKDIYDVTDIVGLRVITFYVDDVEKVASVLERLFEIDWENSIDKRKAHEIDSFGYLSLHYICRIPDTAYSDPEHPELNRIRFEVQIRTVLQHAWANMNHDTGYKSGVEIPREYRRNMSRLAGILELVDDEFSRIRQDLADYRRQVQKLVASGNLGDVLLDGDSFRSYLSIGPFDSLTRRIASINQAEVQPVDLTPFLPLFKAMGFKTLGDVDALIKDCSEAAYQIACFQIGLTDLDILAHVGEHDGRPLHLRGPPGPLYGLHPPERRRQAGPESDAGYLKRSLRRQ